MSPTLQRMWIQLTSDRKRFGLLMAACAMGLLLWARIIVISRPPRTAVADQASAAAAAEDGGGGAAASAHADKRRLPPQPVELAREPHRDPFRISPEFFPRPTLPTIGEEERPKSAATSTEDALRVEMQRTAAIVAAAERLRLEAVMNGAQLAVINGRTIRVGEVLIEGKGPFGFSLVEIKDRSVVLECEGRHIELSMPGVQSDNR